MPLPVSPHSGKPQRSRAAERLLPPRSSGPGSLTTSPFCTRFPPAQWSVPGSLSPPLPASSPFPISSPALLFSLLLETQSAPPGCRTENRGSKVPRAMSVSPGLRSLSVFPPPPPPSLSLDRCPLVPRFVPTSVPGSTSPPAHTEPTPPCPATTPPLCPPDTCPEASSVTGVGWRFPGPYSSLPPGLTGSWILPGSVRLPLSRGHFWEPQTCPTGLRSAPDRASRLSAGPGTPGLQGLNVTPDYYPPTPGWVLAGP